MEITKVKCWSKVVQQDTVDHVKISYSEHGKDITLHEFGSNSTAAPEFYAAIKKFRESVCLSCGWNLDLAPSISVREISIKKSEDKEGNDNTVYTAISSLKAGHTTATLKTEVQHKYLPDGFEEAVKEIVEEAEEYVGGKRQQVEMELQEDDGANDPENYDLPEDEDDEPETAFGEDD